MKDARKERHAHGRASLTTTSDGAGPVGRPSTSPRLVRDLRRKGRTVEETERSRLVKEKVSRLW